LVEQPPMDSFILPSQEEKKPMVDQIAPTQTQLDNKTKTNRNERECRCRHHALAQNLNEETKKKNQNPNLIKSNKETRK
jgi:hypothetical protein